MQSILGPGPVKVLKILEIAKRDGYETKNVDNYAGHSLLLRRRRLGILPIWTSCSLVVVGRQIHTNQKYRWRALCARGSSDDKGPTMACYYGLKIIKDLGLTSASKRAFVVGTDEELYGLLFQTCRTSWSQICFSPDAWIPNHQWGKKETSLSTFILEWQHRKTIALLWQFSKHMVPESKDCSRFWTTTRSCWPLRCLCQGTPAAQVWNLNCDDEETPYRYDWEICSWINPLKMELMVRPTWLFSCWTNLIWWCQAY